MRIARERAFAAILVQALRVSGDVAATGGLSPQAATDFHHEAIDLAQQMGMFPDILHCRASLARLGQVTV